MFGRTTPESYKSDLISSWLFQGIMIFLLSIYLIACSFYGDQLQNPMPEAQRILIRSLLYLLAIITFPLTNLIRHIQLRLNQTMPFVNNDGRVVAKKRYFFTTMVSMLLIESVGLFGFLMFIWGDTANTLYIFISLSALGMYLYRPKLTEYNSIINALTQIN
jgi:uncharacterized membrane protein YbhN (UPF0104 family)